MTAHLHLDGDHARTCDVAVVPPGDHAEDIGPGYDSGNHVLMLGGGGGGAFAIQGTVPELHAFARSIAAALPPAERDDAAAPMSARDAVIPVDPTNGQRGAYVHTYAGGVVGEHGHVVSPTLALVAHGSRGKLHTVTVRLTDAQRANVIRALGGHS